MLHRQSPGNTAASWLAIKFVPVAWGPLVHEDAHSLLPSAAALSSNLPRAHLLKVGHGGSPDHCPEAQAQPPGLQKLALRLQKVTDLVV